MSLVTCQNGLLFFLVYVSRFVVVVSSNTLAGNVGHMSSGGFRSDLLSTEAELQ
jgi:hypothetical protein